MFSDNSQNLFSQDYSQAISLSSQQLQENDEATVSTEVPHERNENTSSTIDIIFEENHQLGGIVTASLESLDKYTEKLKEDFIKVSQQLKESEEIHEEKKRCLINLQMQVENVDSQYQQEVEQRQELVDRKNVLTYEVVALLSHHHKLISNSSENLQEDNKRMKDTITERLSYLKELHNKANADNSKFQTERDILTSKISSIEEESMKYDEEMSKRIDEKRTELVELSERRLKLEELLNVELQDRNQLSEDFRNISMTHEMVKNNISDLQQQMKQVQKKESEEIPKLKLMICSARNELTNITNTYEANEKHITEMNMKKKQAVAKVEQLESSIVESRQQEVKNQEQILISTEKNNSLKIKLEELQSELKRRQNVQLEVIRLKQILEEQASIKEKLTNTTDLNRKENMEVDNKLITIKKEVEDKVVIKDNLQSDHNKLQYKKEQLNCAVEENKKAVQVKRQAIEETLNCKKQNILQVQSDKDSLKMKLKTVEHDHAKLFAENENLDRIYKEKNTDLMALKSKNVLLQATYYEEDYKIYNAAIDEEENKVNDLENSLLENLDKLEDLSYLYNEKTEKEATMKKNDSIWIAEKDAETNKFNLQFQDLVRERAIFQANTDAISQQEVENLNKMKKMINNNKDQCYESELKLHDYKKKSESADKKLNEYMNKIARLEDKLRHVSDTAKVTRNEIKEAFAPNKEEKGHRPTSTMPKTPYPTAKHGILKEDKGHRPTSTMSEMQYRTTKRGILKEVKFKNPYDFDSN